MRFAAVSICIVTILPVGTLSAREREKPREKQSEPTSTRPAWLPDEMPLPLVVKEPKDLEFKRVVEREYLVFNLLAEGKLAYDAGRFADAAEHWETLLQLSNLDREIDRVVRPLAIEARQKAGQQPKVAASPPAPPVVDEQEQPKSKPKKTTVDVHGIVAGGGTAGPGGAVVTMKRSDGKTPKPTPRSKGYLMSQRGKEFIPHVLAVPVGAVVHFENDDTIFHDVFTPNGFDLGLYKKPISKPRTFDSPGVTPLYCNIHAHMNAWIVTVDTPFFAVADSNGRFTIRNVPPGDYTIEVWHEGSSKTSTSTATIAQGTSSLSLSVGSDRRPEAYPLDKYGKPRQTQLGY